MWVLMEEFTRKFRFKHAQITSSMVNGKAGGEKWKSLTGEEKIVSCESHLKFKVQ